MSCLAVNNNEASLAQLLTFVSDQCKEQTIMCRTSRQNVWHTFGRTIPHINVLFALDTVTRLPDSPSKVIRETNQLRTSTSLGSEKLS